jgi:heme exporter protein A
LRLRYSPSGAAFFALDSLSFPAGAELIGEGLACRRGERLVFQGLDCRLPAGGALVLTGPNGSGKSSLLRVLASLLAPAVGLLSWGGAAITEDPPGYRALIHYVGHLDAVKPALNPREMLLFWAELRGAARPGIDRALAAFGLDPVADWPCRWLSAGQRRRLALARLAAVIAAHRGAGGRVVVATHQPIAIEGAAALALDSFAVMPAAALAG